MKRRIFIAGAAFTGMTASAGCIDMQGFLVPEDTEEWPPEIASNTPTVERGQEANVTIQASTGAGIFVRPSSPNDAIEFVFEGATVEPPADNYYSMHPPAWIWDTKTELQLDIPVVIAEDAPLGEYEYRVRIFDEQPADGVNISTDSTENRTQDWRYMDETFILMIQE